MQVHRSWHVVHGLWLIQCSCKRASHGPWALSFFMHTTCLWLVAHSVLMHTHGSWHVGHCLLKLPALGSLFIQCSCKFLAHGMLPTHCSYSNSYGNSLSMQISHPAQCCPPPATVMRQCTRHSRHSCISWWKRFSVSSKDRLRRVLHALADKNMPWG